MPNPYHDARGRFTTKGGNRTGSGSSPAKRLASGGAPGRYVGLGDLKVGDTVNVQQPGRGSQGTVHNVGEYKGERWVNVNTGSADRPNIRRHAFWPGDKTSTIFRYDSPPSRPAADLGSTNRAAHSRKELKKAVHDHRYRVNKSIGVSRLLRKNGVISGADIYVPAGQGGSSAWPRRK